MTSLPSPPENDDPFKSDSLPPAIKDALSTPPGVYSVRKLVATTTPLLDIVLHGLGPDEPHESPARVVLIDGLAASLATKGRESTLPLTHSSQDTGRKEIVEQATKIAKTLIEYVKGSVNSFSATSNVRLRSPCEGHLWTKDVADLLLGPRSGSHLM
jgi:hypothetical protein